MNKTQSTVDPKPSGFDDLLNRLQSLDQDCDETPQNDVPVISQSLKIYSRANVTRKKSFKSQSFHQQAPYNGFNTQKIKKSVKGIDTSNNNRNKSVTSANDSEASSPYYPLDGNKYGSQVIKDQELKVDEEDSAFVSNISINLHRSRKFTKSLIDQQSMGDEPVSPTELKSKKNNQAGAQRSLKKQMATPKRRGKSSNQVKDQTVQYEKKYQKQFTMKKVTTRQDIDLDAPDDLAQLLAKNPSLTISSKSPIPESAQLKKLSGVSGNPQPLPSHPQFNEIEQMKKMQQMHFESPKNETNNRAFRILQPQGQLPSASQVAQKTSGSGDSNINPMESPDIISMSTHLKQRAGQKTLTELNLQSTTFPLPTTPDANLKLRDKNNIISEIANENSEESSQKPGLPVHKSVILSTPLIFPNQTQRFIRMSGSYSQNLNIGGKNGKDLSSSVDRFNQTCSLQEHQEVVLLKRQLRDEKAKFDKQKAILEQQVELLTIQLHEASERDKNQKKKYQFMLKALENKQASEPENPFKLQSANRPSDNTSEGRRISNDTSSPVRYQQSPQAKQKFDSNASQQQSFQQDQMKKQQKEHDEQNTKLMNQLAQLREQIQTSDIQLKTQDRLLLQKEEDIVRIKREVKECQQTLRDHEELKQIEVQRCEQIKTEEAKIHITKLNLQTEKQVAHVAEEYQDKTRRLNEQIIEYQKEIKTLNQELDNQLKLLHHKDSRLLSFEKHIQLHETNIDNLNRDIDRLISENHSKQAKVEKLTKDKERLLIERLNKFKDHQQSQDSQVVDTLDPLTQDIDGTNKFITSPNDSVIQMNNQQYDQQAEYSFGGDLERFSIFVANKEGQRSQGSQVRSDPKASNHTSPDGGEVAEKINFKLQLSQIKEEQDRIAASNSSKTDRQMLSDRQMLTQSNSSLDIRKPIIQTKKSSTSATKVSPAVKGLTSRKNSLLKNSQSDRKVKIDLSASKKSPVRIEYWIKNDEHVFHDDGSYSPEMCDALRRRVAYLRSEHQKLNIKFKDLQFNSKKTIEKLNNEIKNQKRRRIEVQEDKLEQSHQYMQQITDQNKTIAHLQKDVTELVSENAQDINMNQTYFTGVPLMNKSLYASHSVYNLKGQKDQQKIKRTGSIQSRRGSVQSSFSQQSIGQQYKKNLSKTKKSSSKNSNSKNDNQKIEKKISVKRRQTEVCTPSASQFNKTQGLQKHINMFLEESEENQEEGEDDEDDDVYMQKIGGSKDLQSFALSDRNHVKKKVHHEQVVLEENQSELKLSFAGLEPRNDRKEDKRASVNDFKMSFLNSQYSQRETFIPQPQHVNPTDTQEKMRTLKSLDAVNFSKYMTNRNQQTARPTNQSNSDLGISGILCGSTTNLMNCKQQEFQMINPNEVLVGRQQFSGDLAPIMQMPNEQMTDRDINMLTQSLDQEAHPKYDFEQSDDQIRQSMKSLRQGIVPTQYKNEEKNLQMYYQKYKPYTQRVQSRSNGSKSKERNEESEDDDCNLDDIGDENRTNKAEQPLATMPNTNLQTLPSPYEPPNTDRLGDKNRTLAAKTPLSCQSFSTQRSKLAQSQMGQPKNPQGGTPGTQATRRMGKNDSKTNAFSSHFQNALQVMTDTVQQSQMTSQTSMSDSKKFGIPGTNSTSPRQKLQPPAYMKDRLLNSSTQMAMSNKSPQAMQRNNQQVNTLYHSIKNKNQVKIPRLQLSQTNSAGNSAQKNSGNAMSTHQMPHTFGNQFMNLQGRQTVQMSNVFRSTTSGTTMSMGPTLQNKKTNH